MQRRAKILNVARDEVPEYFGDLSEEEDIEVEEEVDFENELKKTSHAIRKAEFDISRLNKIPIPFEIIPVNKWKELDLSPGVPYFCRVNV